MSGDWDLIKVLDGGSMTRSLAAVNNSCCCVWSDKSRYCSKEAGSLARITLFIISLISLTIALFVVLVSAGVIAKVPLYMLHYFAPFGSGVLIGLASTASFIVLGLLVDKIQCNPRTKPLPKEEGAKLLPKEEKKGPENENLADLYGFHLL